ncbi:HlyD family efflux transporter periplasmic adaptor subunit [Leucothrix pacifica]|uniref:LysM domain-containing protein n=1 Tax=Leucothrix pacifica TaxID=1247513 RepID=A0A317CCS0_9GAMM|nr:HlyD family efflux transporter periplasmic adaptor subunit [Leucothrix pacifica]PWQ96485.1 hypothetical protein DKW60_13085 [Leucothrix pacifica]
MNINTQEYQAMKLCHTGLRALCMFALLIIPFQAQSNQNGDLDLDQLATVMTKSTTYNVIAGDSLSKISNYFYGSHDLWGAILNANADQLPGGSTNIFPGMILNIPSLDDAMASSGVSEPTDSLNVADVAALLGGDISGALLTEVSQPASENAKWVYTEGVARAIRREYMTFESAGRIAYLDPKLKEGDRVRKGQVLAYQEQSRSAASLASANTQLVSANTQLISSQSQVSDANAQLVRAQTQVTVAEASRSEADANLLLAKRTFQRYSTLLKQKSASQQEYDEAQAKLVSAQAAVRRAIGQINTAKADVNVAKTGIARAKASVNTAKAGIANAKAGLRTAQVSKKESYLVAPIDGVVARINIEQGYYYSPQYLQTQTEQQVFDTAPIILIDPSRFEVSIKLPAGQYDSVRVGQDAYIDITKVNASLEERLPNEAIGPTQALNTYKIRGRIHSISPVLDTDLRNFLVTIRTTVGHQLLRDGESVSLWIKRGDS